MRNVFQRSPNRGNGNNVANANASGNLGNNNAVNGNFVVPDCVAKTGFCGLPEDDPPAAQRKEPPSGALGREQHGGGHAPIPRGGGASAVPTLEDAIGYDALMESAQACMRGVMWKSSVSHFMLHMNEYVSQLCDELHAGTYRQRQCIEFPITSPKPRTISAAMFRDRVVQRSFNDHVIYPVMSRSWIRDNYACQEGKGTDDGRGRLRCHVERHVREHGETGWFGIWDIHGYYDHLVHVIVNGRFRRKLPEFAAEFAVATLEFQYPRPVGYHPGSQLVQIAGIEYLDPVDHFAKERLRMRGYSRYMDDIVMVHEDREYMEACMAAMADKLSALGLSANPKKTRVQPITEPVSFLGFDYHVRDGDVLMFAKPGKVKEQRRKLRRLAGLVRDGRITEDDYMVSLGCILEHDGKGDSPKLVARMEDYGMTVLEGALRCRSSRNPT